ncbi:hypothetical protein FK521_27460, partial [Klebsiella pneumoniae]|nr:hypothetical protein [Klebsiella pneumoniae]
EQFYTYLKDSFDVLYAEGETAPKMMSVGMHCLVHAENLRSCKPGRRRAAGHEILSQNTCADRRAVK